MDAEHAALFEQWVRERIDAPLEQARPMPLDGQAVSEALWPLNARFAPRLERIKALAYDPRWEAQADMALAALALHGDDWSEVPLGAWRVLYERHSQALIVAQIKRQAGEPMFVIPEGFPERDRTAYVALGLLYRMTLPFGSDGRSHGASTSGAPARPAPRKKH